MSLPRDWTRIVKRTLQVSCIVLVVKYLVVPKFAGTGDWLRLLASVNWWWVALGLVAEIASLVAFSLAARVLLPADRRRPGLWTLWRIDMAGVALSHAVPGGAVAGTALSYRMLNRRGVNSATAAFAKLGQGAVSVVVLQVLLVSSLAIALPLHGSSSLYLTACLAGLAMLILVGAAAVVLVRAEGAVGSVASAVTRWLPRMTAATGRAFAARLAQEVRTAARTPQLLARSAAWSAANWLLDAVALWCCVVAAGHVLGYDGLLVPFCLANVAAWIPLTPSGLGVVEAVVIPALVGFSTPYSVAVFGTTVWRLLNFWLPIPLGAVAYLTFPRAARRRLPGKPKVHASIGTDRCGIND